MQLTRLPVTETRSTSTLPVAEAGSPVTCSVVLVPTGPLVGDSVAVAELARVESGGLGGLGAERGVVHRRQLVELTFGVTLVGHVMYGFGSALPLVTVKTRAPPLSSVIGDWMGFMYWS